MKLEISFEHEIIAPNKFKLGNPISIGRKFDFSAQSQAFSLPKAKSNPVSIENTFIGDVSQGGPCNVDVLSFTPHNLTHIETSAHILNQNSSESTIADIPQNHLFGLVYLADISNLVNETGTISSEIISKILKDIKLPITALALKTKSSSYSHNYNFSGKDFLSLDKDSAKIIHDFGIDQIKMLILDLPSADQEEDGGKLLAHRSFFGLPDTGFDFQDTEKRVICELAHFGNESQGYYYFISTPSKISTNAIITDILFFPIIME